MALEKPKSQFEEALEELDFLILEKLHPKNLIKLTIQEVIQYKTSCLPLKETVKKRLFREVLYQSKERGIENFIHLLQAHLVYLSDTLTSYQVEVTTLKGDFHDDYQSLLELTTSMVIGIISHINCQFSEYFNEDGKVPLAIIEKDKELLFFLRNSLN